jgi:THAP domain
MPKCIVKNCKSSSLGGESLFSLPKDLVVRTQWLEFITASGSQTRQNADHRICENHFVTSAVESKTIKTLVKGSVPTILVPSILGAVVSISFNLGRIWIDYFQF